MNKDRRNRAEAIRTELDQIKDRLHEMTTDLDDIRNEEQEAFDNMNEGLQQTETGQRIEQAADDLDNAHSEMDELDTIIQTIIDYIDEAVGG